MKIAIIGTGVYGISMAKALNKNKNNKIIMWSESEESKNNLEKSRKYFAPLNTSIDEDITISTSYEEVLKDADVAFIMCALKYISSVIKEAAKYLNKKTVLLIGSKGIEDTSCEFAHEIISRYVPKNRIGAISGGSFAIDIASLEPIGLSIASPNKEVREIGKKIFNGTNIKLRETKDIIGIEICGAIKNVIALAAGILDGLGYRESTRSFLITESLHDIKELINSLGGNKKTILSFAGVGDLLLTATSIKSRNYSYGKLIGEGKINEADDFVKNNTVEGYYTLKSVYSLLKKRKLKMPIVNLIYNIILDGKNPKFLAEFLMKKD